MKRIINMRTGMGAAAVALVTLLATGSARAERRPPFGNDAQLLEANVREEVQRRIAPVLEEMAPGQAELKYVDVRVNRPTALAAGADPGFEELAPGADFVAERVEVALTLDAKLPAQFRKDLKNLIKSKLDDARRAGGDHRERDRLSDAAPAAATAGDVPLRLSAAAAPTGAAA